MSKPKLLDLFCGAGGATRGYQLAGFHVTGVDHKPQKRYVGEMFVQADALEYVAEHGHEFDIIHASPPCQAYARLRNSDDHPDMLEPTRQAINGAGCPWVIENIELAPMKTPIRLCGLMFGLQVYRHRLFELSHLVLAPEHPTHKGRRLGVDMYGVYGNPGGVNTRWGHKYARGNASEWKVAMGIDWMTAREMSQAIPPAYTEYIGRELIRMI